MLKIPSFTWQYCGTSDSTYRWIIKDIQNDKRLSNKRKQELINDITYLVGHVVSDCDSSVRHEYSSLYCAGAKSRVVEHRIMDAPTKWQRYWNADLIRDVAMSVSLNALSCVGRVRGRLRKVAENFPS